MSQAMDPKLYQQLEQRIGRDHLRKRVGRQVESATKFYSKGGYASYHLEILCLLTHIIVTILSCWKICLLMSNPLINSLMTLKNILFNMMYFVKHSKIIKMNFCIPLLEGK